MTNLMKTNGNLFPKSSFFFDDSLTRDWFDWVFSNETQKSSLPAVNIRETDASFELEMAAPGMNKKDFTVELENNRLTISAQKKGEQKDEQNKYTRREFSYHYFRRSFALPEEEVEAEQISAKYKDGILYLSIPKSEKAKVKPARMIEIA